MGKKRVNLDPTANKALKKDGGLKKDNDLKKDFKLWMENIDDIISIIPTSGRLGNDRRLPSDKAVGTKNYRYKSDKAITPKLKLKKRSSNKKIEKKIAEPKPDAILSNVEPTIKRDTQGNKSDKKNKVKLGKRARLEEQVKQTRMRKNDTKDTKSFNWEKAQKLSEGEKIRDDPKLLVKAIKRHDKKKAKSATKWKKREEEVIKAMRDRQVARRKNIAARRKNVIAKKKKKGNPKK